MSSSGTLARASNNLRDLKNRLDALNALPECPAEPQTPPPASPPPPPPPPVRTPAYSGVSFDPPPESYFGAPIGMSSGTLGFDYAHFNPKFGSDGDQWGFTGSALFPLMHNVGIGINAGYDRVTSKFFDLDHWTAGASLVWQIGDVRFGPSYGFQRNSASGFSADTHNYGGFGEYFATPWLTVGAKGGGFSSDPGSNGYYVGGQFKGYLMPNLALTGMIDHTHFNAFGGSNENDYSINGEYLFGGGLYRAPWPPISIYGGYTRSNFTPGSFHVDTFFVGIKLYTDGNGATTLVDRQRTGTLGWQTEFAALSLKF